MANENRGTLQRGLERIFNQGSLTGIGKDQLLRQFASCGDASAFEALLTLHGPMVLCVCRRMLFDERDVEDAFQATFLVLLRRAGSLRSTDPLSPWLHGVAYRVAARIRNNAARRRCEERAAAKPEAIAPASTLERHELRGVLDEEIGRLPERYRRPVVLCYLEGLTQEAAARRLRCTAGSVRGRLDRARAKLQDRLVRRGVAPATGLVASILAGEGASAAVPARLIHATVSTLGRAATARAVAVTGASAAACELADGLIRTMMVAKLKLAASILAAGAMMTTMGIIFAAVLPHAVTHDRQSSPLAVLPPMQASTEPSKFPLNGLSTKSIDLQVVEHRTRKPLAGVTVTVKVERKETSRATTDNAGRAAIEVPLPTPSYLAVTARKEGFAPMTGFIRDPSTAAGDIPAKYILAIHPIETITGLVRDEQGQPIEGVLIEPMTWMRSGSSGTDRDEFERPAPVRTDAQGRWICTAIPAGMESRRISFLFSHRDYQQVELPMGKALELIKRGTVTVLPRGLSVAGRVRNTSGRPIPGAQVRWTLDESVRDHPRAMTDADGRFRFEHVPAGEIVLTVQAPGHAPDLKRTAVSQGLGPLEFQLDKGRSIRGHVVDSKGAAVARVTVAVTFWRNCPTLDWRTKTDDTGRFRWDHAPADAISLSCFGKGFLSAGLREVPADTNEVSITLVKRLTVRGLVVDAETRHAIKSFTLIPGIASGAGASTYWERDRSRSLSKGKYEITFDDKHRAEGRRLRIEADGYMPEVSRVIQDDEDEPVVNFVLHKGVGVSGMARLPDRSPLIGADVVLVSPSQPAFIKNGRPPDSVDHRFFKTGADGRFTFPPQEPPYSILVLADQGFAEENIDKPQTSARDLTVAPWGRIEGTFHIGNQPGAGEPVSLSYDRNGDTPNAIPWWSGETTTDRSGHFTFERVIPSAVWVSRDIPVKRSMGRMTIYRSPSFKASVTPGNTTQVRLGGTGRPVIGKLAAPKEITGAIDWTASNNALIIKPSAANLLPIALQKLSKTAGRSVGRLASRGYAVVLEHDGSFRVEDVEVGLYDLHIMVDEPSCDSTGFSHRRDTLGTASRTVTIPPMPAGRSDEPLDLGTIPLKPAKKMVDIKIGAPAPAFRIETIDEKTLSLADFRGKFILLDFWATWCGPCLAETPHLKAAFEAFNKDERFVMIGLSLDKTRNDPRQYAAKHGLGWSQGFLGAWDQAKLPDQYGVRGIPSIWLIGPDGTVIAKDLRGPQIKSAVADALGLP